MAFFLKLVVFSVWAIIMATLILGSIQGSSGLRRRPFTDKIKSSGDKEGGRYLLCPACWTSRKIACAG